jgi:hypothetical protein
MGFRKPEYIAVSAVLANISENRAIAYDKAFLDEWVGGELPDRANLDYPRRGIGTQCALH